MEQLSIELKKKNWS